MFFLRIFVASPNLFWAQMGPKNRVFGPKHIFWSHMGPKNPFIFGSSWDQKMLLAGKKHNKDRAMKGFFDCFSLPLHHQAPTAPSAPAASPGRLKLRSPQDCSRLSWAGRGIMCRACVRHSGSSSTRWQTQVGHGRARSLSPRGRPRAHAESSPRLMWTTTGSLLWT